MSLELKRAEAAKVLPQVETRNRIWNPDTLEWEVVTNEVQDTFTNQALVVYEDGNIMYVCKAVTGSAQNASVWQIKKIDFSSGIVMTWADGDDKYDNLATDLATVQGLSYS